MIISSKVLLLLSIFLVVLYGVAQLIAATKWGAGLSPDSVEYILAARSIIENGSLKELGSHYPPLYQIVLASISIFGPNVLTVARWTQVFIYISNISIFGILIYQSTVKSILPTIIGCLLLASSQLFLEIHAMAWSEPLFLTFTLIGLLLLTHHFKRNCDLMLLAGSAVFFGLALITRYAGFAFILTGCLFVFLMNNNKWPRKSYNSILFFIASLVPFSIWVIRNLLSNGSATNRQFVFHPVSLERILQGFNEILSWFQLPVNHPLLLLFIFVIIVFLILLSRKISSKVLNPFLLELCFLFVVVYVTFIIFSISFLDFIIPLDGRILSPVYLLTFLGLIILSDRFIKGEHFKLVGYGLLVLLVINSFMQMTIQKRYLKFVENGIGYASKEWIESDVLEWLKGRPTNTLVYSNAPEPITLYTETKSNMVPRHTFTGTFGRNENIFRELNEMAGELLNNNGYIIYFDNISWRWYLPTVQQLQKVLPLEIIYHGKDGDVYSIKNQ